ncbi:hypothetical protein SK128_007714, partial [Halocaridina rubra]
MSEFSAWFLNEEGWGFSRPQQDHWAPYAPSNLFQSPTSLITQYSTFKSKRHYFLSVLPGAQPIGSHNTNDATDRRLNIHAKELTTHN